MGEIRGWLVRSGSFRPDYEIRGQTLSDAIRGNLSMICRDALPGAGGWHAVTATAEWRPDIMRGNGGVELVIQAVRKGGPGGKATYPVWIVAASADMREPVSLTVEGAG